MGGNAESIWIEKDQKKVIFDMKISTPNGILFAMNLNRNTKTSNKTKIIVVKQKV